MAAIILPKPGRWLATPDAVDPQYRRFWDGLYCAIPLWFDGDLIGGKLLTSFGHAQGVLESSEGAGEMVWEVGPLGDYIRWTAAENNDGVDVPGDQGYRVSDTSPSTCAVVFSWDGTSGDQHSLVTQGGTSDLRIRLGSGTAPTALYSISSNIFGASMIEVDHWYALIMTERAWVSSDLQFRLRSLTTGEEWSAQDAINQADESDAMRFGTQASNDPGDGVAVAGAFMWHRSMGDAEMDLWMQDPFGMLRPFFGPTGPITRVGTVQTGENINGGDVTLTFDGALLEGDVVVVTGNVGNAAGDGVDGPSTAGYTEQARVNAGVDDHNSGVWTKPMGASPDATVVCQGTGNAQDGTAYSCIVLRGVDITTPMDAVPVLTTGVTENADLDAITTVTDGAWVLGLVGLNQDSDTCDGPPVGYADFGTIKSAAETNLAQVAISSKEIDIAGVENPGAYDWPAATFQWAGYTVAIRPSVEEAITDTVLHHFASMIGV